jgi:hypothetical protein
MIKKDFYVSPKVDVLVVQAEGVVCGSNQTMMLFYDLENTNTAGASFSSGNIINGGSY